MRRRILLRSVERHLPGGSEPTAPVVRGAVVFSTSGRGMGLAAVGGLAAATAAGAFGASGSASIMIGFGTLLLATAATTNFRVVAEVASSNPSRRFAVLRGSRVRQAATGFVQWMEDPPHWLEKVGSSFVSSQWRIGHELFTATKRAEKALEEMLAGRHR